MYVTKTSLEITSDNAKIAKNCEIKDGVLLINNHKYEDGKWFVFGEDGHWYYLGIGANPSIELNQVDNEELALQVFEKVEDIDDDIFAKEQE
jgi:hypothetical protein